ncbi:hypothetical protein [Mycolicibacterium sp. 050158]|uniref:hypothetical protein n=1 Tax=Mycolicibacterium sp. 050158 TaxID=3090602 RepID=UPI00299F23CD|nr:hypothetical protein [Mycolicibacterium sp. 050158]MDX1889652.1 hypothetical protein [Mycolicibacterium sp. 050158]
MATPAVGVLVTAMLAFPATAAADDQPPVDPALVPGAPAPPPPPGPTVPMMGQLGPAGLDVLAQSNAAPAMGALGAPPVVGLDRDTILGQNTVPSAPGAGPGTPPNLNVFNNAYGPGAINLTPAAPGQGQQFGVAPGDENADITKRQWFGRYIDLYRAGDLKGGLLGQVPQQQLGEPLPGTAPPPGTVIPAGPVQFLPDPADGPTPPPGLILPPPPADAPPAP